MKKKSRASASVLKFSPLSSKNPVEYRGTRGRLYFNAETFKKIPAKMLGVPPCLLVTPNKALIAKRPKTPRCLWKEAILSDFKIGKTYPIRVDKGRTYNMTVLGLNVLYDESQDAMVPAIRGQVADKIEIFLQYREGGSGRLYKVEVGAIPNDPYFWTIAKPETAGSEPINLRGYKFFDLRGDFELVKGKPRGAFVAANNEANMRENIVHVSGRCVRTLTNMQNLIVGSACQPFVGDPWTFKNMGTYCGLYSFQGVHVAVFQVGTNYLIIPTCGDKITINAWIKCPNQVIIAQINAKLNEFKNLEEEIGRLLRQLD